MSELPGMSDRLTDRGRKVLQLSMREALQLGHTYVAAEHILLGLIREGENVAAVVLVNDFGLDLARVRLAVINRLAGYAERERVQRDAERKDRDAKETDYVESVVRRVLQVMKEKGDA